MLVKAICKNCESEFLDDPNEGYGGNVFCSNKCVIIFQKKNSKHIVENNKRIRKRVLAKYENKCFVCKESKQKLLVHHKDGSGDLEQWERSNNNLDNLVLLCYSCHSKVHNGKVKI